MNSFNHIKENLEGGHPAFPSSSIPDLSLCLLDTSLYISVGFICLQIFVSSVLQFRRRCWMKWWIEMLNKVSIMYNTLLLTSVLVAPYVIVN